MNPEPSPPDERWHGKGDVTLKWTAESYFGLRVHVHSSGSVSQIQSRHPGDVGEVPAPFEV